uniref:hypothetical protein n=1 Tax=Gluconobacter thailandicus TaxID=257438 RepID=UPI000A7DB73E|nr:hypothetical protein [Gluconobacter thailandicus]
MTVYSFACSTPDNWSSWHIWVRTFGPGIITACVTGSIAAAAYIVARTQREIAANKYDLDLFDKRYPLFEKINDAAEKIENYDTEKEFIVENIQSLDTYEKIHSHCNQFIIYISKISNFNIEVIINIYDEINKSVRLYRNITPEKVSLLKSKIEILNKNKNKTYEFDSNKNKICDTTDTNLRSYLLNMHRNIIKSSRNEKLDNIEVQIKGHKDDIHKIENKLEPHNNYTYEDGRRDIREHEYLIHSLTKEKNNFIQNEVPINNEYQEFIYYISESFNAMNEIKSCIIFIREEMNKHLNVSDVSYKKIWNFPS